MCNKHVHSTVTRSSRFHCLIGVTKKTNDGRDVYTTCIPLWRNFQVHSVEIAHVTMTTSPRPLREHSSQD